MTHAKECTLPSDVAYEFYYSLINLFSRFILNNSIATYTRRMHLCTALFYVLKFAPTYSKCIPSEPKKIKANRCIGEALHVQINIYNFNIICMKNE